MPEYREAIGNGAMWAKTSAKGNNFLSGVMEFSPAAGAPPVKVQFVAFEQEQKQSDRSPDYRILVNSCEPAPARASKGAKSPGGAPQASRGAPPQESDEDIPF